MKEKNPVHKHNFFQKIFYLGKQTIVHYNRDDVMDMGATLSYYTIFALPAIIIISVTFAGIFFEEDSVRIEILNEIKRLLGEGAAQQMQEVIAQINSQERSPWAALVGFLVLFFGAAGVFRALQNALNTIFGVHTLLKRNMLRILTNRVMSFGMVLAVSFIILISLIINTLFLSLGRFLASSRTLRGISSDWVEIFQGSGVFVWQSILTFFAFTLFFAVIYRVLPDVKLQWKHIFGGAVLTSVLFGLGEFLLGFYLANTNMWTAYGAAGSVVVILIWVYYSSQMVFIGAEFIKVYCQYRGHEIRPKEYAIMNKWEGIKEKRNKKRNKKMLNEKN